jgi:hypothetical protein
VCVCVCVCVSELVRERESERVCVYVVTQICETNTFLLKGMKFFFQQAGNPTVITMVSILLNLFFFLTNDQEKVFRQRCRSMK